MLNWQHLLDGTIPKHHQDYLATTAFPAQGLSAMLVSPGKGSCRHHRFARALARCHCKQWVPGRLIGLRERSFILKIYNKTPFLLWIVKNNGFLIMKYQWFVNFTYIFKSKYKLRKNSSLNWFTPFHVLICPDVIWKNVSRPLYYVHFTVIHTNSRHNYPFYHDVGDISDLSQSEAPNLVMWRVRVMQPTTPSPWRRGRSWPQFNVQENGSMKCY